MGAGPLAGVRVIEIAGIGPGPFAAMLLADLGAEVLRIDRKDGAASARAMGMDFSKDISNRGRPSAALDLKNPQAVAVLLELLKPADVLLEGFRPGVMGGPGARRPARAPRRARYQLHRDVGNAAYIRGAERASGPARQYRR